MDKNHVNIYFPENFADGYPDFVCLHCGERAHYESSMTMTEWKEKSKEFTQAHRNCPPPAPEVLSARVDELLVHNPKKEGPWQAAG